MRQIILIFCATLYVCNAKVYSKCEFARIAKQNGLTEIGTWTCIVSHESRFNTDTISYDGDYGILQISNSYWCGPGKPCGISCDSLLNDELSDDIKCARQIFENSRRHGKVGFSPWSTYRYCQGNQNQWIASCNI